MALHNLLLAILADLELIGCTSESAPNTLPVKTLQMRSNGIDIELPFLQGVQVSSSYGGVSAPHLP